MVIKNAVPKTTHKTILPDLLSGGPGGGDGGTGGGVTMHLSEVPNDTHEQVEFVSQSYYVFLFLHNLKSMAEHLDSTHSQVLFVRHITSFDLFVPLQGTGSHAPIA